MKSIRKSFCFGSPISSTALNIKHNIYKNIIRYSHKKTRVSSNTKYPTFLVRKVKKNVKNLSTHYIGRKQDSGAPKNWHFTKKLIDLPKNESALETSYNCLAPTFMFNNFTLPTFSHLENSFNLFNLKEDKTREAQNDVDLYRNRLYNLINQKEIENETFKSDLLESSVKNELTIQDEFINAEDEILGTTPSNQIWKTDSIQASIKGDFILPKDNVTITIVPANRPKKLKTEITSSYLDQRQIQDENISLFPPNFYLNELPEINCSEGKDYEDELRKIPFEQGPSTDPSSILNILNSIDKSAVIIQKDIYITNRILDQIRKKEDEKDKKIEALETFPEERIFMLKNNGQIVEESFKMCNFRSNNISRPNMIQSRQSHDSSKKPSDSKLNVDMSTKTIITSTNKESGSEISVVEVQKFTDKRLPFPFSTETVLQVFGSKDKLSDALSVVEQSKAKLAVLNNAETTKKGIESFQNMLTSLKSNKKETIPLIIPIDPLNDKNTPQPTPDVLLKQAKHAELVKLAQTITANNKAMRITFTNKPKRIVIRKNQNRVKKNPSERKPFKESIEKVKIIGPKQIDLILGLSPKESVAKRKSAYFQPSKTQNMIKNQEVKKKIVKRKNNPPKPVMEIKPLMSDIDKKEINIKKEDDDDGLSLRDKSILKDILDGKYKFVTTQASKDPPKRKTSSNGSGKGPEEPPDDSHISKKMIEQMKKDSCENPIFPIREKGCDVKEIENKKPDKKVEKQAKFNYINEKGNEPKVTIIEHYGTPKPQPKENKPIKEPKITIIEHYTTSVKTNTAPKEEIKPVNATHNKDLGNVSKPMVDTHKRDLGNATKPMNIDTHKRDLSNATKPMNIDTHKRDLSNATKPIDTHKRDLSNATKPMNIDTHKRDLSNVTKPVDTDTHNRDLSNVTKPMNIDTHKRDLSNVTKPMDTDTHKRDLSNVTKPMDTHKRDLSNVTKPMDAHKRDLSNVTKPMDTHKRDLSNVTKPMDTHKRDLSNVTKPMDTHKRDLSNVTKPMVTDTHKIDVREPKATDMHKRDLSDVTKPAISTNTHKRDLSNVTKPMITDTHKRDLSNASNDKDLGNVKVSVVIPQRSIKRQTMKSPDKDVDKSLDKGVNYPRIFYVPKKTEEVKVEDLKTVSFDSVTNQPIDQPITASIPKPMEVAQPKTIKKVELSDPKLVQKPEEIHQPQLSQPINNPEIESYKESMFVHSQALKKLEQSLPKFDKKPNSDPVQTTVQKPEVQPVQNSQSINQPDSVVSPKIAKSQPITQQSKPVQKPVELKQKEKNEAQVQFISVQEPIIKPQIQNPVSDVKIQKKHPVFEDPPKEPALKQVEVKRPNSAPNESKSNQVQGSKKVKKSYSSTLKTNSQSNLHKVLIKDQSEALKNRVLEKMNFITNEAVAEVPSPPQISEFLFNFDKFGKETNPILDTTLCRECPVPEHKILDYPMINLAKGGRHDPIKHGIISIEINNNVMLKKQLKGVPSVTTVLNTTMADSSKAALSKWRTTMVHQLGEAGFRDFYKEQLKKGSDFHGSVHQYLKTHSLIEKTDDSLTFKSVQDVLKNISDVSVLESQVVHPQLGYRGVVDCVAKYKGAPVIIEWKRSDKPKPTVRHTFDAPLQLSAYIGALNFDKSYDVKIQGAVVVVAYSDGTKADVFSLSLDECSTYWKQWLGRLKSYISINQGFPLSPL